MKKRSLDCSNERFGLKKHAHKSPCMTKPDGQLRQLPAKHLCVELFKSFPYKWNCRFHLNEYIERSPPYTYTNLFKTSQNKKSTPEE